MKYHLVGPSSIECITCTMIFIIIMTGKIIMHTINSIIDGHCMSVVIFFLLQNIITYSNMTSCIGLIRKLERWQSGNQNVKRNCIIYPASWILIAE
jgi:hypothetical protein